MVFVVLFWMIPYSDYSIFFTCSLLRRVTFEGDVSNSSCLAANRKLETKNFVICRNSGHVVGYEVIRVCPQIENPDTTT